VAVNLAMVCARLSTVLPNRQPAFRLQKKNNLESFHSEWRS